MFNPYIVVPFAVWAACQALKFVIKALKGDIDFRYLYASGGMPSVHSATVVSLAVTALLQDGWESHLFGLTAVFAAIVMYDSFGVRRTAGEQAAVINRLIESLDKTRLKVSEPELKLREVLGHTPTEVAVGGLLGAVLGAAFNISKLQPQLDWLLSAPFEVEFWVYLVVFALLIIGGLVLKIWLGKRYRGSKAIADFAKKILIKTQVIGWLGLVTSFAQFEKLYILSARAWPILVFAALIAWDGWLFVRYNESLPQALAAEAQTARKQKWLEKPKKSKAKKRR